MMLGYDFVWPWLSDRVEVELLTDNPRWLGLEVGGCLYAALDITRPDATENEVGGYCSVKVNQGLD
jgi:hypothetical protein